MNQLPEGWVVEPFSEVAQYAAGRTPARANDVYWKQGSDQVPWVAISDMTEYGTITKTSETISGTAFQDVFRGQVVPAGTLLMSFKLTIGRIATLGVPACHNEAIISIYPRNGVDQRYLGYFLSQVDYSEHQDRQVKGNTLNQSKINRIPISLPPTKEQRSIADVLDQCREGIQTEFLAEKTTQELKQATMRELFTRGLRGEAQKETEIGLIPESWGVSKLNSGLVEFQGGFAFKSKDTVKRSKTQLIRMANLYNHKFDLTRSPVYYPDTFIEKFERYILHSGDLIISLTGTMGKEDYGYTVKIPDNCEVNLLLNQRVARISPNEKEVIKDFILHYFQFKDFLQRVFATAKGTKQANLSTHVMGEIPIPIPNMNEQVQIATILNAIDNKIVLHKQKRAVIEELFKALLHKLMSGETRVSELNLTALMSDEVIL